MMRNPGVGLYDQVRYKLECTATCTYASLRVEILDKETTEIELYMNNKGAGPCTITLILCAVEAGAQMYTENAGFRNMFK